jgi:hypothetical protein
MTPDVRSGVPEWDRDATAPVRVTYRATRLTFKRDRIEPLAPDEPFEVVTPEGIFRLTKREFNAAFRNVAESVSYRDRGNYNYSVLPRKASRFRVA